jgi:hypothetical protein
MRDEDHLDEADRRLDEARRLLAKQEAFLQNRHLTPEEFARGKELLLSMRRTLKVFEAHRAAIARVVDRRGGGGSGRA